MARSTFLGARAYTCRAVRRTVRPCVEGNPPRQTQPTAQRRPHGQETAETQRRQEKEQRPTVQHRQGLRPAYLAGRPGCLLQGTGRRQKVFEALVKEGLTIQRKTQAV